MLALKAASLITDSWGLPADTDRAALPTHSANPKVSNGITRLITAIFTALFTALSTALFDRKIAAITGLPVKSVERQRATTRMTTVFGSLLPRFH
jgi:hypothetical protein